MAGSVSMTIRKKRSSGLDFFPTQPWATRALMELVPVNGWVWEPACGGGHISAVLEERENLSVWSSDIHDHGYPWMNATMDFLTGPDSILEFGKQVPVCYPPIDPDWIVTNPPFHNDMGEMFVRRALETTPNVAVLCRLSWLEGMGRCERLFVPTPPSRVIVLTERLGFEEGACVVGRGGMIPYAWYVWEEGVTGTRLSWVPGGTKSRLTKPDDEERFNGAVVKF